MKVTKGKFHGLAMGAFLALGLGSSAAQAGPTAEQRCEAGKHLTSGKYLACQGKAKKGLLTTGDAVKYADAIAKCESKLLGSWSKLEAGAAAAGTSCPSTGDIAAVQNFLDVCIVDLSEGVSGGSLPPDLDVVVASLGECTADLGVCDGSLAACDGLPDGLPPLRTGQTTAHGSGSDGAVQAGSARSFTDNGDGTITDNVTKLMWEKKDDSGGIHDRDSLFQWWDGEADGAPLNGTIVTTFLATLNSTVFAGHNDWRLPNQFELMTLVNLETSNPATHSAFNSGCTGGCTVLTCSCTTSSQAYASSTSMQNVEGGIAWLLNFVDGSSSAGFKGSVAGYPVRAVRDAS